jgi:alanine racemase
MSRQPDAVKVTIDLARVRANAMAIKRKTRRPLIAVVKSDAYGLGARAVAETLAGIADEFAYFNIEEARALRKPGLVLGPLSGTAHAHAVLGVRPAVSSLAEARAVGPVPAAINVDTGMRWLGCRPEEFDRICRACNAVEAFTHTLSLAGVRLLQRLSAGRTLRLHAAATRLLSRPAAWLDAVRPGLAIYQGAMTVTARLLMVRDLDGPAGYRRFHARRAGVILCGYSRGFPPGVVQLNGRPRRVLEVGMNTSMIEIGPRDRLGDRVLLLGGALTETTVARAAGCKPHEILCRYSQLGPRRHLDRER